MRGERRRAGAVRLRRRLEDRAPYMSERQAKRDDGKSSTRTFRSHDGWVEANRTFADIRERARMESDEETY